MMPVCLQAADQADVSVEVVDLRTLFPWDRETVLSSVRKTGRLLVVQEPQLSCGMAAEVSAVVAEEAMFDLKGPIIRVAGFDTPWPQFAVEKHALVNSNRVLAGIRKATEA
jgi:pyruvate dehydrogenase E1 component beta subunit